MSYTKGPWHWVNSKTDQPYNFKDKWDGYGYPSLRTVEEFGENKTEVIDGKSYTSFALPEFILDAEPIYNEANAQLIAAAPELFETLQEVVAFWDSITMEDYVNDIHVRARAAIAKAKGEQP